MEKQAEVEGEKEEEQLRDDDTWMACGWNDKTSASGLEQCGVMNDQTRTLKTACRCAQFCMLRMFMCGVSFLFTLSTMVSMMLNVYLSLYIFLRSHLLVNCCIRRYSLYTSLFVADVIKSFDTVDRKILDRGLPGWFRHAYFEYHAHVRLRFKLATGLGEPWTRDGGIPQGCPLSMMFIVAL